MTVNEIKLKPLFAHNVSEQTHYVIVTTFTGTKWMKSVQHHHLL